MLINFRHPEKKKIVCFALKLFFMYHKLDLFFKADLAYQIMKIAERLTNHGKPYGLYWTDLSYENLVVDDAGRVTVVDVENVVVVDRTAIRKG